MGTPRFIAFFCVMTASLLLTMPGCKEKSESSTPATPKPAPQTEPDTSSRTPGVSEEPTPVAPTEAEPAPVAPTETEPAPADAPPQVVIDTSMGRIVVELDEKRTPITVANFLQYVDDEFYDNTLFHRVISRFMIQGGGIGPDYVEKPAGAPIQNESQQAGGNKRGTIAMARKDDPNSATCQFYINHKDNPSLDTYGGGYCAFGQVVEGMDVVDAIAGVATTTKPLTLQGAPRPIPSPDVPVDEVVIHSIRRK